MKRIVLPWLATLVTLLSAVSDGGQPVQLPKLPKFEAPVIGNSSMPTLLPALRTAPAPGWVRPGTRITYYSAAAAIPGERYLYYRDEDGNWVDEHGRSYRREAEASASGHGYTQVNVVAMSQEAVVLGIRSYGLLNVTGPPVLMSSAGGVDVPGCTGDYWANPAILKQAVGMQAEHTVVLRMPYTIQSRTYQAIRVQYATRHAKMAYVFDEPTGVLLFTNSSVFNPVTHRTTLAYSSYRGTRTVAIPWAADAVPNWLAAIQRAQFSGSYAVTIPGTPVIPMAMSAQAQVKSRGVNWLQYTLTVTMGGVQGMPPQINQAEAVSGYAQIGGLFVSPVGLRKLRQGQIIDRDTFTQVTATVSAVGQGAVTISEVGPGQRTDFTYSTQTGMLTALRMVNQHLHMQRELRLTGTQ